MGSVTEENKVALFAAARQGDVSSEVKKIVSQYTADQIVSLVDNASNGLLHVAAMRGHIEFVEYFLELEGAWNSVDWQGNEGMTPIHLAAQEGYLDVIKSMKIHYPGHMGRNTESWEDGYGMTPVHWAAKNGHVKVVEYILNNEVFIADVNDVTVWKRSALHYAAMEGHADVCLKLISYPSVNMNACNRNGYTALHLAAAAGYAEVCRVLISSDVVDINARDKGGFTALHLAAKSGYAKVCSVLIRRDELDVHATVHGQTAFELAKKSNHNSVCDILNKRIQTLDRRS